MINNSKRIIGIGDIHGQLELTKTLIDEEIKFNPDEDILIFLGDYIDRGDRDVEWSLLKYLDNLRRMNPHSIILLKGNHEWLAEIAIEKQDDFSFRGWKCNGGTDKILFWDKDQMNFLYSFIQSLKLFHETDTHIFVHAGATEDALINLDQDVLLWDRNRNQRRCYNKQLVIGHTIRDEILIDHNRICLDTGAVRSGHLSAYDIINDCKYST